MTDHETQNELLEKSPLHEEHQALGAKLVPFAGFEMPIQYRGIVEEHNSTRASVGIFDVSHMAAFRVFGAGAESFLSRMCTNDISKISEIGAAQYTLLLRDDGGILDDLIVYRTGDQEFMIIANAGNHQKDFAWLEKHLPAAETSGGALEVELVDESERTALIAVQGPKALRVITELATGDIELPARFHLVSAVLDTVPVLIARTGYTGEDGVELVVPSGFASRLWRALLSFPEVEPVGLGARDTLRLEMGYSLYGNDITEDTDPISAGLGWAVRKSGGFIGSEAISKIREEGPKEKLVFLRLATGSGVPRQGYPILHNGEEVGKVASGSFSPVLGRGIASAYVPIDLSQLGQTLQVQIRKRVVDAEVVKPPFIEK